MVVTVEVVQRGLDLSVLAERLRPEVAQKLVERLADVALYSAFFEAPWRTGYLAQSLVKEVGDLEASVSPLAPYAVYVEYGTAPHEIRPVRASVLCFEGPKGGLVFTRLVNHPGTRANPFMQRAADETAKQAPEVFDELWSAEASD